MWPATVAVLGASNYTYAEATRTQKKRDFVASTIRALEYIGGVPELVSASATAGASVAEASRAT